VAWELLVEDVRDAADVLRPVYEAQAGADRIMIVRAGQDEPMFDATTLRLLPQEK